MAEERTGDTRASATIMCRRLGHERAVAEHLSCPYCYGRVIDVQGGDHERFCDYDAARDPILFGFPEDKGRLAGE